MRETRARITPAEAAIERRAKLTADPALALIEWTEWVLRANGWHKAGPETGGPQLHQKLTEHLEARNITPR